MRGTAIVLALMLAGCASRATDVAPAYVSPMTYSSLSCAQLADEAARLVQQVNVVSGQQDSQAQRDAPTVRFYTPDGKSAGSATTYGTETKIYAPDGRLIATRIGR